MSMVVWENETTTTKVKIGGEVLEYEKVTAEEIKKIAKEKGIKKFIVEKENGEILSPEDFPVESGTIIIKEYNEAK